MVTPLRRLATGTLLSAIGNGAWYTSWALFLTRSVGLSPAQVGVGMMLAGGVGLLAATPLGWLADRVGAREVYAALLLVQGAAALGYLAVGGPLAFVASGTYGAMAGNLALKVMEGLLRPLPLLPRALPRFRRGWPPPWSP